MILLGLATVGCLLFLLLWGRINEQRWRDALRRAVDQAVECGHLRAGDTDQYVFERYALPLAVHHQAGLFGEEVAVRHGEQAVERWFATHAP